MPEIQLGAHTLRSHGVQMARIHMHDWLILFLLVVIDIVLNVIEPFHRFVGKGMMEDLMYPFKGNTVPFWAVPIIAILLPFCVILVYYFIRKDVYDFHQATLGLLFSVLITAVITDSIKDGVGRPRPDFFWRCFPDGKGVFNNITGNVMCTGLKSVIKEGHKSFPSGHTSWSFAGLGFLAWYVSGKVRAFDRRGHVAKLCIVFSPILLAALVAVSRVDDYWHHWQDVFAGSLIGLVVASFCYLQFFPLPYDTDGHLQIRIYSHGFRSRTSPDPDLQSWLPLKVRILVQRSRLGTSCIFSHARRIKKRSSAFKYQHRFSQFSSWRNGKWDETLTFCFRVYILVMSFFLETSMGGFQNNVLIREGNLSDVPLTQPGKGPEGTADLKKYS